MSQLLGDHLRHPARPLAAFTLVELLVVIGIIAVLIAILLPSLNVARAQAASVKCLSNLKQINLAMMMYANDNRGWLPPELVRFVAATPTIVDVNGVATPTRMCWFGGWVDSTVNPATPFVADASILKRYWGNANIGGCPSFVEEVDLLRPMYGPTSYAYNVYAGNFYGNNTSATSTDRLGIKLSKFRRASEKALVWDSAFVNNGNLDRLPWGYPSSGNRNLTPASTYPTFHARHRARGNVGWADGHAASAEPFYAATFVNSAVSPARAKQLHVGLIDADGNLATDENYAPE